jgi:hypothetical protein
VGYKTIYVSIHIVLDRLVHYVFNSFDKKRKWDQMTNIVAERVKQPYCLDQTIGIHQDGEMAILERSNSDKRARDVCD